MHSRESWILEGERGKETETERKRQKEEREKRREAGTERFSGQPCGPALKGGLGTGCSLKPSL